jgi:hypothetical protein
MKRTYFTLILFVAFSFCGLASRAQDQFTDWPALGEFHDIISETFHPVEEGKFDPVKARSGELYDKADKLSKSAIPEKYDRPEIKTALKELVEKADELYRQVKKRGKEDKIKQDITAVHDTFHKIVGLCTEPKKN